MGKVINMVPEMAENLPIQAEEQQLIERLIDAAAEKEYLLFEKAVRENAKPPLKGEITQGKLKWRGITRCYNKLTGESWLEQRGLRISEKFRIVFS